MRRAVGFDIGGTRLKAVCCDNAGRVIGRASVATSDEGDAWRDGVKSVLATIESEHGPADAIGVSCPGIARPDGTGIAWMGGRMTGVVGFDFTAHFARGGRVPVLNDAVAALYGEAWCGAARGVQNALLYTLGTGVGGAILIDGKPLRGATGRAGHLGHMTVDAAGPPDICNTPGSIEHAIGNYSLAERTGGRYASTDALVRAIRDNDEAASATWQKSIRALGAAIASMINAVDPELIILGGGVAAAGPALLDPLAVELARFEWRPLGTGVPVVIAQLGEWAGAIGAARAAFDTGLT